MPKFEYRAMTSQGNIVKNTVTEASRTACIKRLKRSGLTPISVKAAVQITVTNGKQDVSKRKNLKSKEEIRQEQAIKAGISKRKNEEISLWKKMNSVVISTTQQVSARDIRIFTQDFYLLKKAGFNNIQALTTVIHNTENNTLKQILEDVLAGVEAGEFMYSTLEYYSTVFPYIYINMIKVGELSGTLEESLEQAVKYLEDKDTLSRKGSLKRESC